MDPEVATRLSPMPGFAANALTTYVFSMPSCLSTIPSSRYTLEAAFGSVPSVVYRMTAPGIEQFNTILTESAKTPDMGSMTTARISSKT